MSFSFGTPSSAPATSAITGGFNFGANKPSFGMTTTTQASTGLFGNTSASATPSFGGFGSTATPAFGTSATNPISFGNTTTPAFGAQPAAPGFGAATSLAFGATSTTPAFGTTSTAPTFGATSGAPAFGALSTTPAFGTQTAAPAFGAGSSAPTFGASTTPAFGTTSSGFGTGLGAGSLNFGTGTNTAVTTGLSFGATTTTSTGLGGLGGFGFGTNPTTQATGFGLFATTTTTTSSLFGNKLGTTGIVTQPTTSVTPSVGLGGLSTTIGGIGATNTTTTGDGKVELPKQTKLPNEISTTVDSFKEFVKKQKLLSSDVMRVSVKPLYKVSRDAESTLRVAMSLSGEVSRARAHSRRLRTAGASALAATEAAARDPPGSELEGMAPPNYVKELLSELEQQLITLKRQMDVADKQLQTSPKLLSEQELTLGIRRMHESFVALAGRLQAVHTQVEAQKEQYLNLRKYILKDLTNVFDTPSPNTSLDQILRDAEGNRKKTKSGLYTSRYGSAVLSDPRISLGNLQQLAGPTPFSYIGSTLASVPGADHTGLSVQPTDQLSFNSQLGIKNTNTVASVNPGVGFQLQKPPGKRVKQ